MAYATATVGTAGRGTASSQSMSLSNVPAGAMVVVSAVAWNSSAATMTFPATLTDSSSNTLTRRAAGTITVNGVNMVTYEGVMAALVASWSITLTQTGGSGSFQWDAVACYYTANPATSEHFTSITGSSSNTTSLTVGPSSTTDAATELAFTSYSTDSPSSTVYSSATLTTGHTWIYRQNDDSSLQAHGIAEGIQGISGLNLHSTTVSVVASSIASGNNIGALSLFEVAAGGGGAQDTPELRGRPDGLRGQMQMHQLLAQ